MSEARARYIKRFIPSLLAGDVNAIEMTPPPPPVLAGLEAGGAAGGEYTFSFEFTGGPLTVKALGADGVTLRTVVAVAAAGTLAATVKVGEGTRLFLTADVDATNVSYALREVY